MPEQDKTQKRQVFLASENVSLQMSVGDLRKAIAYYAKKHGIKIYINGEFAWPKRLEDLKGPLKYAAFLERNYFPEGTRFDFITKAVGISLSCYSDDKERSLHSTLGALIQLGIKKKLEDHEMLTDAEKQELQQTVTQSNNAALLAELDRRITIEIDLLQKNNPTVFFPMEAVQEMASIARQLKAGEYAGYVYTNTAHRDQDHGHFEVVILERNIISKPVSWGRNIHTTLRLWDFSSDDEFSDVIFYSHPFEITKTNIAMQGDEVSCGSLGVLHLKKLLKKGAKEYNENIKFMCCIKNASSYTPSLQLVGMMIPPLSALHYSQSRTYINALEKFLLSAQEADETTLQKLLTESLKLIDAEQKRLLQKSEKKETLTEQETKFLEKAKTAQRECTDLLSQLPALREKWSAQIAAEKKLHQEMQTENTGNRYLLFRADGLRKKSTVQSPDPTAQPGSATAQPSPDKTS